MLKDKDGVSWTLSVDGYKICRFCNKEIAISAKAYWCPVDKKMSCVDCKDQDNDYKHSKIYLLKEDDKHIHYYVTLIKEDK